MINVSTFLKLCAVAVAIGGTAGAVVGYMEKKENNRKAEVVKRNITDLTAHCNDIISLYGQKHLSGHQLANLMEIRRRVDAKFSNMRYDEILELQTQIEVIYNVLNAARK